MFQLIVIARSTLCQQMAKQPDKGWGTADQGSSGIIGTLALIVVVALIWGLWALFNSGSETSNLQAIATNTKGYMGGRGGYAFSSGTTMTGNLIQRGLAPSSMRVVGDESSGTATLWNTWGGQVVLAPVSSGAGINNGFSITYNKVPLKECISIAQQYGNGAIFNEITLNSSVHSDGSVTAEEAGKECTKNSGSTGTNTMVFTVNG